MITSGADLITLAFGAFNLLRLASYFPQIAAVARDQHGATAISFSCWSIWIGANASTALYAWINLGDATLALINAFNTACCVTVLLLAMYKRGATYILKSDSEGWMGTLGRERQQRGNKRTMVDFDRDAPNSQTFPIWLQRNTAR